MTGAETIVPEPLIITASCGNTRPDGAGDGPETVDGIVEAVVEAAQAGAAIVQIRAPHSIDAATGRPVTDARTWAELIEKIRARSNILVHMGVAAMPVEQRIELLQTLRPEFASFLLGHHDILVRGRDLNSLRTRPDQRRLMLAHADLGVVPDFEIFHSGCVWNLEFLSRQIEISQPWAATLFFGWDGGEWSPATVEEQLTRVRMLPAPTAYSVTAASAEQNAMHALAIVRGGHVRVGLGDYSYYHDGIVAQSTAQFVARVARLAKELNRNVATPADAARIMKARPRSGGGH